MRRDELVQITHKLGYDYVWKDIWGGWKMASCHPFLTDISSKTPYWWQYGSSPIYCDVEFDGSHHESLLFYGDTLAKSMEDQYTETENRG